MRFALFSTVACLFAVLTGCQEPAAPAGPTIARVIVEDEEQFDQLWDVTVDVLRAHDLWPDRQDRQARVLRTFPDTSAASWEFWKLLPTSPFGHVEADLQTVRREAEVRFTSIANANEYEMNVRVDVSRYSTIERQATSSAAAFQMFGAKLPTVEGRVEPRQASAYWLSLGRDETMELALVDRILRRYSGESYREVHADGVTTQPALE